ncbi:MAG: LysM peptidoglycan-binding domain-containing protein [Nitrospirales bacterium]|nr:LysM peptidoglycan-binding domain-containing protein [Nitrospirales bacterium]
MAWFLPFFIVFILSFLSPVNASTSTYTVKKGDSLYEIADKFDVSVAELKEANSLRSKKIKPGVKLTIPGKDHSAKKSGEKRKEKDTPSAKVEKTTKEEIFHTVKKGDTLEKIAKKYDLSKKEIISLNNIRKERLKPGQKLLVKRAEETKGKTKEIASQERKESATYYTVKKGDTLKKISRKFNVEIADLMALNGMKKKSLSSGERIVVARMKEEPKETKEAKNRTDQPLDEGSGVQATVFGQTKEIVQGPELPAEDLQKMSIPNRLMLFAKKMLQIPYRFGGNGNFGIDCSAYVKKVYSLVGLELPRSAREQFRVGEEVDKEELTVGDLVFFRTYASFPSHVGIYLGNNLFIHASSRAKKVTIDRLDEPYYVKRFIGAKRLVPDDKPTFLEGDLLGIK